MSIELKELGMTLPELQTIVLTGPPPPLDLEFKVKEPTAAFLKEDLGAGRCFGSKSGYRSSHPRCIFLPNANVFCERFGKVWWGDLDLRRDKPALERVSRRLRVRLYVLSEHDGRWENAESAFSDVLYRAYWCTGGAGKVPEVTRYLARSGLSRSQLAAVIDVNPSRLRRNQTPEMALEVHRRLVDCDRTFFVPTGTLGFQHWGQWWMASNRKLKGMSPNDMFLTKRRVELGKLLGHVTGFKWYDWTWTAQRRL